MEKEKDEILQEEPEVGETEGTEKTEGNEKTMGKAESVTDEAVNDMADNSEVVAEERDELQEANDKYMRLAAEYQNFRRRTETEKQNIAAYANERIAKAMLDVVDNFERALASSKTEDDSFKNGIDLIYKQLMNVLKDFGVEPIEALGREFDPNFHNAVMSEQVEGTEAGIVLMEMQKGYMLRERVIRPSMVKVSA